MQIKITTKYNFMFYQIGNIKASDWTKWWQGFEIAQVAALTGTITIGEQFATA